MTIGNKYQQTIADFKIHLDPQINAKYSKNLCLIHYKSQWQQMRCQQLINLHHFYL